MRKCPKVGHNNHVKRVAMTENFSLHFCHSLDDLRSEREKFPGTPPHGTSTKEEQRREGLKRQLQLVVRLRNALCL